MKNCRCSSTRFCVLICIFFSSIFLCKWFTQAIFRPQFLQQELTTELNDSEHLELIGERQQLLHVIGVYIAGARVGVVEDQTEDLGGYGTDDDLSGLGFAAFQAVGEKGLEVGAHRG